jgi:hypothetical protein
MNYDHIARALATPLPRRPDSNTRMVQRTHVKHWLLQFAPPSVISDLLETIEDKNDRKMLEAIYLELTGKELHQ